jgi:DNA sulfur modification protein DndE
MPPIIIPTFPSKIFSIVDYGAVTDGKTLCTKAFATAIDACSKAGGGIVNVPEGIWLTGPIELKSNINLHIEKNALVQFTKDHSQYPIIKAGNSSTNFTPASPIYAYNAKNIAITGEGSFDGAGDSWRPVKKEKTTAQQWSDLTRAGVVSNDGKVWWPTLEAMNGEEYLKRIKAKDATEKDFLPARDYLRPYMLYLVHCENILLENITLKNSPKFVFYPNHCTNLIMNKVNVYNDWWAQNGDGIDISACKNVVIYKCNVNAGDDGICMKSSGGKDYNKAELENIVIAGCTVLRAHGGFVIGSNTDGGMKNIYVTDCNFIGTDIGIRVKSNAGRGGLVKDIYIDRITMKNIKNEAILFSSYYEDVPAGKEAKDVRTTATNKIPEFTNFYLRNITCDGAKQAVNIVGLSEMQVHDIYIENAVIKASKGFTATEANNVFLKNVQLAVPTPIFSLTKSSNIWLDGKAVN